MNKLILSAIVKLYGKRVAGGGYEMFIPHTFFQSETLPKEASLQEERTSEGVYLRFFPNKTIIGEYAEVGLKQQLSDTLSEPISE
jgi:hypothetical protein